MQQVTVRIPASTSNLGPGFDCLGVALGLYDNVTISRKNVSPLPPIAREATNLFFDRARMNPFQISFSATGEIPRARGLGSSATVRTGVLYGLNVLTGKPLSRRHLFELTAQLEGHPDNAAPAAFGGFNVARDTRWQRFPVSSCLHFVLLIPDFKVSTLKARQLLPKRLTQKAAVASCRNACAITAAFVSQRY